MKRFLLITALIFSVFVTGLQAQTSNIKFPAGSATVLTSSTDTITVAVTPKNTVEFLTITSATFDVNTTINITDTYAKAGYLLYIEATPADTLTLAFGTNFVGNTYTCLQGKKYIITAVHNGTDYVVTSILKED